MESTTVYVPRDILLAHLLLDLRLRFVVENSGGPNVIYGSNRPSLPRYTLDGCCQRKCHFRIRLDPNSGCTTLSQPYPRIIDLASTILGLLSLLQLNCYGNTMIDRFIY